MMGKDPHVFNKLRNSKMKKLLPFTNVIYASNINAIEEEWLYNDPDFLSGSKIDDQSIISLLKSDDFRSESVGKVIGDTILVLKDGLKIGKLDWSSSTLNRLGSEWKKSSPFSVVDRKKLKRLVRRRQRQSEPRPWDPESESVVSTLNESLFKYLGASRTAADAKKRFIWLSEADSLTAFACWAASPGREMHALSLFFDRHARYETNVWDDTSIVFNEWQTEMHLSFYVVVDSQGRSVLPKVALANRINKVRRTTKGTQPRFAPPDEVDKTFPGSHWVEKVLRRASISFRFDGDFFDRHWTCHFIEYVPSIRSETERKSPLEYSTKNEFDSKSVNSGEVQRALWQRKVLELHLFYRTLLEIDQASRLFVQEVQAGLGNDPNSLSLDIPDDERGFGSIKHFRRLGKALEYMAEDLTTILSTIQKWNVREENRGEEKPEMDPE